MAKVKDDRDQLRGRVTLGRGIQLDSFEREAFMAVDLAACVWRALWHRKPKVTGYQQQVRTHRRIEVLLMAVDFSVKRLSFEQRLMTSGALIYGLGLGYVVTLAPNHIRVEYRRPGQPDVPW